MKGEGRVRDREVCTSSAAGPLLNLGIADIALRSTPRCVVTRSLTFNPVHIHHTGGQLRFHGRLGLFPSMLGALYSAVQP